jgi:predicted transcriptional regulator
VKTAISLPDDIFEAAEELAEELGMSRSHLYAQAVAEFVAHHRNEDITERLNAIYGEAPSALDPVLAELQSRSLSRDDW